MRTGALVFAVVVCAGCKSGLEARGDAVITAARPELVGEQVVLVVDVDFRKQAPGDATRLFLTIGSNAMRQLAAFSVDAEHLAGMTEPANPALPRAGEHRRYRVPLPLTERFEARAGLRLDLLLNLAWGTGPEGMLHQSRMDLDIASLYRRRPAGAPE